MRIELQHIERKLQHIERKYSGILIKHSPPASEVSRFRRWIFPRWAACHSPRMFFTLRRALLGPHFFSWLTGTISKLFWMHSHVRCFISASLASSLILYSGTCVDLFSMWSAPGRVSNKSDLQSQSPGMLHYIRCPCLLIQVSIYRSIVHSCHGSYSSS